MTANDSTPETGQESVDERGRRGYVAPATARENNDVEPAEVLRAVAAHLSAEPWDEEAAADAVTLAVDLLIRAAGVEEA